MGVEIKRVEEGESGMRLDRWFKVHYPGLAFGYLQKLLRSGQIRVDGRRVKTDIRLVIGQSIRVPFLSVDNKKNKTTKKPCTNSHNYRNNTIYKTMLMR